MGDRCCNFGNVRPDAGQRSKVQNGPGPLLPWSGEAGEADWAREWFSQHQATEPCLRGGHGLSCGLPSGFGAQPVALFSTATITKPRGCRDDRQPLAHAIEVNYNLGGK